MVLTVTITSCSKEFPNIPFNSKDLAISDCKTKGEITREFDSEYITLTVIDDYFLVYNHFNTIFNCDPGQITLYIDNSNNTITIEENELIKGMHCLCPYDIKCVLGPLHYGKYSCLFKKAGITFKEFSLDFNKSTNIRIDL